MLGEPGEREGGMGGKRGREERRGEEGGEVERGAAVANRYFCRSGCEPLFLSQRLRTAISVAAVANRYFCRLQPAEGCAGGVGPWGGRLAASL